MSIRGLELLELQALTAGDGDVGLLGPSSPLSATVPGVAKWTLDLLHLHTPTATAVRKQTASLPLITLNGQTDTSQAMRIAHPLVLYSPVLASLIADLQAGMPSSRA